MSLINVCTQGSVTSMRGKNSDREDRGFWKMRPSEGTSGVLGFSQTTHVCVVYVCAEKKHANLVSRLEKIGTIFCFKKWLCEEGRMLSCATAWLDYRTLLFNQTPIQVSL